MIPIPLNQIRPLDIIIHKHDSENLKSKKSLRQYEYYWCNQHRDEIQQKAQKLYDMYTRRDPQYKNIQYCVNFLSLEIICDQYNLTHAPQHYNQDPSTK